MAKQLNRYHRKVGDASLRQSEYIVDIGMDGSAHTLRGEILSIGVAPNYSNFSFNISGGGSYQDSRRSHFEITMTYAFGTDGNFWEDLAERKEDGEDEQFAITILSEDQRSRRLNGGRVVRYNNWHLLTHTDYDDANSDETTPRRGQVTIYAPRDAKKVIRKFKAVQGV